MDSFPQMSCVAREIDMQMIVHDIENDYSSQPQFYNKVIPKSNKYAHVKPSINSGLTTEKLKKKLGEAHLNARFRKEENFQRIKRAQLTQIMQEDLVVFLLLDVRDREEYEKCHISGAISYPAPMLNRSVNEFVEVPQIYEYKNKSDRLIIVYDYNEEIGVRACTQFFEKGFDNVVLLTGGLKHYFDKYAFLVDGTLPQMEKKRSTKSHAPSVTTKYSVTTTNTQTTRLASSLAKPKISNEKKPFK